ncbi:hypothetical protein [Cyclobacterium jeungdonense]|uniref:Phage abortive infection protein n=1 Tax=Cyclobacterium jeungdonense TaxID=708087 RepID=A0ABT8CAS0_9BACT|nr:hypothetical protein [Cyclobacterium jeungdonense]MDN3688708.1 hypothetical protein [Cyclobacterium jeungdonense]
MELDKGLADSEWNLRLRINIFFWLAILFALAALGSALFPGRIYDWFLDNPRDHANNLSVIMASLSGVFLVYVAFLGQRWQILFQQQELRENMKEMQKLTAQNEIQGNALNEQIKKMDRDFVHQNFFRILEQHFKTRDRVEFYDEINSPFDSKSIKIREKSENAFKELFWKINVWVDSKFGWLEEQNEKSENYFLVENGFAWQPRRPKLGLFGDPTGLRFNLDPEQELTKPEITFIIRAVMTQFQFDTYLRSCYYLFDYMMKNKFSQYLVAVDAGMGTYERSFLFYQVATRFEVDGRIDLKHWLMDHRFLANIETKHLLSPEHIELLYPIGSGPEFEKISNPHP